MCISSVQLRDLPIDRSLQIKLDPHDLQIPNRVAVRHMLPQLHGPRLAIVIAKLHMPLAARAIATDQNPIRAARRQDAHLGHPISMLKSQSWQVLREGSKYTSTSQMVQLIRF